MILYLKDGNIVQKYQNPANPIKRQKYRYIPSEKGGWDRITDDSMSDIFSTMEVKPNKVTTGSDITRKQQQPTSTYRSAYNPDDVIKGFNILTLGGLNNLSPTQWVGRYKDFGKLAMSSKDNPTMTWSGFVDNWINGNSGLVSQKFEKEHPYISTGINLLGDAIVLGGNPNKVAQTANLIKKAPDAAKIAVDVARNSSNPTNLRNYKFLGDSRFYSDLTTPDVVMAERKAGNYPLTFTERRNYINGFKKDIQEGVDYAMNEARQNLKVPLKGGKAIETTKNGWVSFDIEPRTANDIKPQNIHYGTTKATNVYGATPQQGKYAAFQSSTDGLFFPFRDGDSTLKTNSFLRTKGERISTGAHETRHTIQNNFWTPLTQQYDVPGYGRYTNTNLPVDFKRKVNTFISEAGTEGTWQGSLSEMDAELTGWSAQHNLPRYSDMNPQQKAKIYDLFQKRFGSGTTYNSGALINNQGVNIQHNATQIDNSRIGQIIQGLENLGYRKQGGVIHIKKKNRGKFTAYCGGNVTSACIARAKASGNPTLVKRATFAANARKWKHQQGGTFKTSKLNTFEQFKAEFPGLYAIGKAIDPTGISGYKDVKEADKQWEKDPSLSNGYNVAMEALGAAPIISVGSKLWKALQGIVTGRGLIKDYREASALGDIYNNELIIDYLDNTVKPRKDFKEKLKYHVDYTDSNHMPAPELAPSGYKSGQVIKNYQYKYANHPRVLKYKKQRGGKLCLIPRN